MILSCHRLRAVSGVYPFMELKNKDATSHFLVHNQEVAGLKLNKLGFGFTIGIIFLK